VVLGSKVGNRFTHNWTYQGPTTRIPTSRITTGPAPLGSDFGCLAHSVKMDACSQGKVRAISCPLAVMVRARKGKAGQWYPGTPQYGSHHSDVSLALHARPWIKRRDPDQGTHPQVGRVSEGQNHGTQKPLCSATPEVTAVVSGVCQHSSIDITIASRVPNCQWIHTPCPQMVGKGKAHVAKPAGRPKWPLAQ
jgi:hypothetical protein